MTFQNTFCWTMTLKSWHSLTYFHMVVVHITQKRDQSSYIFRKYFQQCLLNVDIQFAQNIKYLFCAQHIVDLKHMQNESNLAMRLSQCRTQDGHTITAGILWNPQEMQQLVRNQQAYKFLRNIQRSPPYWQHELYDVLAMLRSLGIPTWFLTLSAADLHWPEMIQAVAIQFCRNLSRTDVMKMSIQERSHYL